jgi:hypothetical protein
MFVRYMSRQSDRLRFQAIVFLCRPTLIQTLLTLLQQVSVIYFCRLQRDVDLGRGHVFSHSCDLSLRQRRIFLATQK